MVPLKVSQSVILNDVQNKRAQVIQRGMTWLDAECKQWTPPSKTSQVAGLVTDRTRSKTELLAENRFLR